MLAKEFYKEIADETKTAAFLWKSGLLEAENLYINDDYFFCK